MAKNILLQRSVMQDFPKIELHRHLEGTFPMDRLFEMAQKNGLVIPGSIEEFKKENQFPRDGEPDFLLFLSKFKTDWYRTLDDVSFITYHSVLTFKSDGLFYIELRFNPEHFAMQNNFDREVVTKLVIESALKAANEIGVQIKFLITLNRGKLTSEEMIALYEKIKNISPHICGFDLAGDETNFPPEKFKDFFIHLKKDGKYNATVHAGEVSPATQIWEAIKGLHAKRIGHGTSALEDEELQDYLIEHQIALEQCMTSNYQTGSWRDIKTHPFGRLYRKGVPVTLNSDDPSIQDTDLTDDYINAVKFFKLDLEDLVKINQTAIKAAFLTEKERDKLSKSYLEAVQAFKVRHKLS